MSRGRAWPLGVAVLAAFAVVKEGYAAVSAVSLGIAVLFVGLAALARKADGRLARTRWTM